MEHTQQDRAGRPGAGEDYWERTRNIYFENSGGEDGQAPFQDHERIITPSYAFARRQRASPPPARNESAVGHCDLGRSRRGQGGVTLSQFLRQSYLRMQRRREACEAPSRSLSRM